MTASRESPIQRLISLAEAAKGDFGNRTWRGQKFRNGRKGYLSGEVCWEAEDTSRDAGEGDGGAFLLCG
jgi:hypothetical protein